MKDTIAKGAWQFAKRYRITLLLWIILLAFGAFSYTSLLPREGFPSIAVPAANIQGTYFADSPQKIDSEIVQPITRALNELDSIDTYQATSGDNFYNIFVTFTEETEAADGAKEVEATIESITTLPAGTTPATTAIDPSKFDNKYTMLLAVYDQTDSDYQSLTEKADNVAAQLTDNKAIEAADVIDVLTAATTPTGATIQRQTDINKVAVRENDQLVYYPAITIGIEKGGDVDDVQLSQIINDEINNLDLASTNVTVTADPAVEVNEQIESLQMNLIGGLIAVVVVVMLLISWRAALVVALFIPTVLAATFVGLGIMGITLNIVSLFAVILTLGLFVDDATIIVEAIDAHRRDKKKAKEIITQALGRVGMATVAGTLTTIIVFTPMLYVSGILGDFIRIMPLTVIFALGASLIISLILIPFLSRPLVLSGRKRRGILDRLSFLVPIERYLATKLSHLPNLSKRHKIRGRLTAIGLVGLSLAAMVGAVFFAGKLPLNIFPQAKDSNILTATIEFEPGTTIATAEKATDTIDQRIADTIGNEVESISYASANERSASLQINLTHYNERDVTSHELIDRLQASGESVGDAAVVYAQSDQGPPASDFPFQMRVYGQNEDTLRRASAEISSYIAHRTVTADGVEVKVAEVTGGEGTSINRSERGMFTTISARFDQPAYSASAIIELETAITNEFTESKLGHLGLTSDAFDFDVSQESENMGSFTSMGVGLVVAMALMYLLLVIMFNSFLQPLLIIIAIPFSLFGVFFGLWATDNALSFFVMVGLMGLIGIVVNNTILLTEYANQERAAGASRTTAISRAMKDRFRPLVTTTLTTVVALTPLAITDPFWQPLAITLIFGMLSSTLLIILSFPYYYLLTERIRDFKHRKLPGTK